MTVTLVKDRLGTGNTRRGQRQRLCPACTENNPGYWRPTR